jgi:hypothetical protein
MSSVRLKEEAFNINTATDIRHFYLKKTLLEREVINIGYIFYQACYTKMNITLSAA